MSLSRTIRYKALLLLTVFAANFFVVCHCSARAARPAEHPSCCSKKVEERPPCKDGNECGGMHAMKFNLLEKQTAKEITTGAQAAMVVSILEWPVRAVHVTRTFTDTYTYQHPPPDYQSLYQCFLI
jgi:hypothetical protein